MKAEHFHNAAQKLSELIADRLPAINQGLALNASAIVKNRLLNSGTKADGSTLGKYSEHELPAFFFKDKALNGSGRKLYEDSKKEGKGISYKQWREANNRPTDHVTLSFSGDTLRDIGVVKVEAQAGVVNTTVGPKNTIAHANGVSTETITDDYLGNQYGNFMQPSEEEIKTLTAAAEAAFLKLINESFK